MGSKFYSYFSFQNHNQTTDFFIFDYYRNKYQLQFIFYENQDSPFFFRRWFTNHFFRNPQIYKFFMNHFFINHQIYKTVMFIFNLKVYFFEFLEIHLKYLQTLKIIIFFMQTITYFQGSPHLLPKITFFIIFLKILVHFILLINLSF